MKFYITKNGEFLGTIYAPNYTTALARAVEIYGTNIEIEEK